MFISKGLAFEVEFVLIKKQFMLDWEMAWRFMKLILGERKLYIFYIIAKLCTISIIKNQTPPTWYNRVKIYSKFF